MRPQEVRLVDSGLRVKLNLDIRIIERLAFIALLAVAVGQVVRFATAGRVQMVGLALSDGGLVLAALTVGLRAMSLWKMSVPGMLRLAGVASFVSIFSGATIVILKHLGVTHWGPALFYGAFGVLMTVCVTTFLLPGYWPGSWLQRFMRNRTR